MLFLYHDACKLNNLSLPACRNKIDQWFSVHYRSKKSVVFVKPLSYVIYETTMFPIKNKDEDNQETAITNVFTVMYFASCLNSGPLVCHDVMENLA